MRKRSTYTTKFDDEAIQLFEEKGVINAVKVRRIMQLTNDMTSKPFSDLSVLDLGCGEGVYSLEAGLRGAKVTGLDGRDHRLKDGREVADRLGLSNVNFVVDDVRNLTTDKYGNFDVIYLLGLLYHLDEPELFDILKNIYHMCDDVLIIDTTVALSSPLDVQYGGKTYHGLKYVEHEEGDSEELMIDKRVMHSIGNKRSFLPTKRSLVRFLSDLGFSAVLECYAPLESQKRESRITLVCIKGEAEKIDAYRWINDLNEEEIASKLQKEIATIPYVLGHKGGVKGRLRKSIDKFLAKRGYELRKKMTDDQKLK